MGKFSENFEQYFLQLIAGQRRDLRDKFFLIFLFVASRFYRMGVQFRIWLYDKRVVRNRSIGCLVVSIGNVSCGGTGKTPVVEVFAKSLCQKGRKVAILSRGYRSKKIPFWKKMAQRLRSEKMETPPKIVSDGNNLLLNSQYAGDEPYMLATNLKDVAVIVDKDRVKSGLHAIDKFETDTLILDDGFQYLDLKPHINIVLIDSTDPFGNHHVLPRGILREPIKNLRRADYIFLTKSNGGSHLKHLKNFLRRHNHRAEIIECCHKPRYLEKVYERGEREDLEFLQKRKIAAISAIACPESFELFLGRLGGEIVHSKRYADHHRFSQQELIDFVIAAKAAGAETIVTTEKDAVRMPRLNRYDLNFYFLRVEIDILSGRENFDQCISRICFL
ncbi:MAG: tetraacyldisaccharide 4'-kinase [Victivallaceae bacterium]